MTSVKYDGVETLAPLIAIVGCDGSGKSTLAADLVAWMAGERPTQYSYLGLKSGNMGNRIKSWPIIGKAFEAYLANKAGQARDKSAVIPGAVTALAIFIFSRIRRRRFNAMMALRRKSVLVITDRYPQIEVPGFYDGPGLSAARAEGAIVKWLSARELGMYRQMAAVVPDLVIRLNIDIDTAMTRKSDHKRELLMAKIAVTPQLEFNGAKIVDLSSLNPYEAVLANSKQAILAMLKREEG